MAYGDFKAKIIAKNIAKILLKILTYDGNQRGLASMVYKYFDKKRSGGAVKNEIVSNKELSEELQKLKHFYSMLGVVRVNKQ